MVSSRLFLVLFFNSSSVAFTLVASNLPSRSHRGVQSTSKIYSGNGNLEGSLSSSILKKDLLSAIPSIPFGAPATNLTISQESLDGIQRIACNLELLTPLPPLSKSPKALQALDGDWQLVFSDASEITKISKLPLGFRLGPVFQCIDVNDGRFENQALIKHKLFILSGHTRVIADFFLAPLGEVNRIGVKNIGSRANVKFKKVIFSLRRFLLIPTFGKVRKTAIPNGPSEQKGVIPSIDITYLDNTMRISRGGDGSLFILTKYGQQIKKAMPMLPKEIVEQIAVNDAAPTYDASVDILPSGSRD
mmetsp:Transcript_5977/g.12517  ORF Transcript_5977/g.12517 Transcript_5977/m.12517 type:complete len:304 (-) Transcript_5977:39-950(-)